jgi:hypothetical protein
MKFKFHPDVMPVRVAVMTLFSCSDDSVYLTLDKEAITVEAAAAGETISVKASGAWNASSDAEWVTVTPTAGNGDGTIDLQIAENTEFSPRKAAILVTGEGVKPQIVTLSQAADVAFMTVEHDIPDPIPAAGGTYTLIVTSNVAWSAESAQTEWCVIEASSDKGNGEIAVTIAANATVMARSAAIVVTGTQGVAKQVISFEQTGAEPYLTIDNNFPAEVPAAGGMDYLIDVTSNITWSVVSSADWAEVYPTASTGNGKIEIYVHQNQTYDVRTATFTVTGEGVEAQTATLTQAATPLASGTWAYSNVYLGADGNPTFAVYADDTKAQYQGLHFHWGSLFGISPSELPTNTTYVVFSPSEYEGTTVSSYADIPYMTEAKERNPNLDQFATTYGSTGYDAAAGKGDICRYITAHGWVSGRWRMPTSTELQNYYKQGSVATGSFSAIPGTNTDGTTGISQGYYFGTGAEQRFFPAVGYRSVEGVLNRVGIYGTYWTSSPFNNGNAYNMLFDYGYVDYGSQSYKQWASSVRCIAE